jgi:hypothetical protein
MYLSLRKISRSAPLLANAPVINHHPDGRFDVRAEASRYPASKPVLVPTLVRIEYDERQLEVLGCDMFLVEVGESVDYVAEGACVADLVPGEGGQASWKIDQHGSYNGDEKNLLHNAVIGMRIAKSYAITR